MAREAKRDVVGLDAIEGQPRAVALLRRALAARRVAHAYAFVGPAGSGRATTARAFARTLLCETDAGCGRCRPCALVAAGAHPDLHVLAPTPPPSNPRGARAIRIDAVRELERQAALRPALGRRRVLIVDEADRMTGESPEAFLKFLEEPPPDTVIVLVLPHARAVPATVLSRCQVVRFAPRDGGRSAGALDEATALLETARTDGVAALLRRTDRMDRAGAEAVLDGLRLHCRDLLLARAGAPPALLADPGRGEQVAAEAARCSIARLVEAAEACRRAREALVYNVTPRLTVETTVLRLLATTS